MTAKIIDWFTMHFFDLAIGIVVALVVFFCGYWLYGYLNPPKPVETLTQQQAETPHYVQQVAEQAQTPITAPQAKEVAKEIQIIRETQKEPVYIVQSTGATVEKDVQTAREENKADFAIVTSKDNPDEKVDLSAIPKDEKVELNQYNINAFKKQLNTIGYAPQEKVAEYTHQWKVSNDGQYMGIGVSYDFDDKKTYVKFVYTW